MSVPPELLAQLQQQGGGQGGGGGQLPPELMAQLGVAGTPGPAAGYGQDMTSSDPLSVLQQCIQTLPSVIAALPDPRDTQDATRALLLLTGIQTRLMQPPAGGAPGGQPGRP